jgi:predicted nucleic acid-binding protein
MGQRFLIDTNVIIGVLKNDIPKQNMPKFIEIINSSFIVSTVVNIETLGFKGITPKDKSETERFLSQATVIYIDKLIEHKAIEIRQQKKMKLGDSIIAATALVNDLTIVTRNETDFYGLGLMIYNPFDQK